MHVHEEMIDQKSESSMNGGGVDPYEIFPWQYPTTNNFLPGIRNSPIVLKREFRIKKALNGEIPVKEYNALILQIPPLQHNCPGRSAYSQ